jgi:hypothetical protein
MPTASLSEISSRYWVCYGCPWRSRALSAFFVIPGYYTALRNMMLNQDSSGLPGAIGLMFLLGIVMFVCFNMISIAVAPPAPDATPDQVIAFLDQFAVQLSAMLPVLVPVVFVLYVIVFGRITRAEAFAYRALVPAGETGVKSSA